MKQFIAACVLFFVLTVGALSASVTLANRAEEIRSMVETLRTASPAERKEGAERVREAWDQSRFAISMVVNHNEFDKLENTLTDVCTAAQIENGDDFAIAAAELHRNLQDLRGILDISWDNIL